jgi:signal transduction histidine kinase
LFYPEEDRAAGKPPAELERAKRDGQLEDEGWRLRKDGTRFWSNVIITALRDETGELVGFGKVTRDLTERRAAEQRALEDARRMADVEAASRAKSGFLAALSHELRTPLNAIGGYVDLLLLQLRGPLTDDQRADLERIRSSQQHLLGLINDLLNFSRIEAGRLIYNLRTVAVGPAVETVCGMVAPQAAAKDLELSCRSEDAGETVHADSLKLEQILLNLVSNAIKFTEPGGRVALDYQRNGDMIAIEVRDTGLGIPADQLDTIFEPFVQLGRSLSNIQEGAGLGLSISRELARAMGGDLRATSRPGAGSVFTLLLPAVEPSE